jgi:hypothetical protein
LEGTAGTAGTAGKKYLLLGKSCVLDAICSYMYPSEYKVAAPTDKAANNVKGTTLHQLLDIKVEKHA